MAEQDTSRLGDALGVNRGLDTTTVPTILGGLGRKQDLSSRAQYAREQLPDLTGRQIEEEFASRVGKSRAEQTGLRGDVEAARTKAIQQAGLYQEADTGQKEYQKFEAPKYTTDEYVGDAAKRLLMGLLMGGVGKVSSINQLRAIKTMQEAEDANQMDRYGQALREWEQNEKARLDHNKRLKERIENALKLSETDYTAAMAEAKLAAAEAQEGTIAADLNQMKLSEAIKKLEAIDKLENETQARIRQEQAKAATRGTTGRAGQYALTYASRVYGNIQNAYQDLENIQNLPDIAQSPVLSGLINRDPETAFGSVTALVGRKVTDKEARAFDQVANSLSAALARLESQGLASGGTKANIAAFDAVKPRAGDDAINMALYIARVKQEIQVGINVHEKMPGATEEQKQEAKAILRELDRIVPFDTKDVMDVLRKRNRPMSERMNAILNRPTIMEQVKPETIERDGKLYRLNPETGKYREVISGE